MIVHGRPTVRALVPILFVLLSSGCAASAASSREAAGASNPAESGAGAENGNAESQDSAALAVEAAAAEPGTIPRGRLNTTLDAGLGRFLGTVRVDAVLQRGSFVGFRIVSFRDPQGIYEGVDLLPGDVVVRVNGSPIERPEQALAVWNGLRVTSELCVEYVRNGERREIRYPIVD